MASPLEKYSKRLEGTQVFSNISDFRRLDEEGFVWKRVLVLGDTNLPVRPGFLCLVDYDGYIVGTPDFCFDSTRQTEVSLIFRANSDSLIVGLSNAISTMAQGEISEILILPEYGYGELGCPPRIPPNSILLYQIELKMVVDDIPGRNFFSSYKNNPSHIDDISFPVFMEAMNSMKSYGNFLYNLENLKSALESYEQCLNTSLSFSFSSPEEEESLKQVAVGLHMNIGLCSTKLGLYDVAIKNYTRVLVMAPTNHDAVFRLGTVYLSLRDYKRAYPLLKWSKSVFPTSCEVSEAMEKYQRESTTHTYCDSHEKWDIS